MVFTKGNKIAVGNKGGRRPSVKEEVEAARELITQEALIQLANSKVYKQMMKENEDEMVNYVRTKEVALPITLRGITEKKEFGGRVQIEQITGMEIIKDESPIQNKNRQTNTSE